MKIVNGDPVRRYNVRRTLTGRVKVGVVYVRGRLSV